MGRMIHGAIDMHQRRQFMHGGHYEGEIWWKICDGRKSHAGRNEARAMFPFPLSIAEVWQRKIKY